MLSAIKEALGTTVLEGTGRGGGGCISEGEVYHTDTGKVFIKRNSKEKAREMFDGEYASLKTTLPYRLHLHNLKAKEQATGGRVGSASPSYVEEFGFPVNTSCGYLSQDNTWNKDWLVFYSRKLNHQVSLIQEEYGDREVGELWTHLQVKMPKYFSGIEVLPSLLHGDLWSGNAAQTTVEPVIFDPASFYGHHEYDLAIAAAFGGFPRPFWEEYHTLIPKASGWNKRHKLYKLFHYLNHWNHFGSGYRSQSLGQMRDLCL
ncbi:ketosamine-3-kinase-like [Eriocheir sinensis]|uniref:ketosamine-3-kinase-like n=1 Tax=Eriocheir sinensis TaxID=95602 RepID=UPI0021C828F2|nr:ketosamine-3-kinase-like [Eriocheir sinensis]